MKGIIQMTILEPLVHLYQKLRRCCRHNNIKIFFCSFVLLAGLWGNFFPLNFILLWEQIPPPHTETCEVTHKQSSKQHPSAAETANWKLTWEILTGGKKNTSHMTVNLLLFLFNDCVIIHIKGLHCKVLWFYHILWKTMFNSRPISQVWRWHSPNQH